LSELARFYHLLKQILDDVRQCDQQAHPEGPWAALDEANFQARVEPIANRMYDMACAAVDIQARTLTGVLAKSQVLLDWCDADGDLKDALARSLCADIQSMADEPRSEPSPGKEA
jgi:hypothetical protein